MNTAEKLRFLADRVEDGKEFYTYTYVYEFIDSKLSVVNDLGEYQQSILTIEDLLSYDLKQKPQWEFTEDEKVILRNLPDSFRWIARDESDKLYIYTLKPTKANNHWAYGIGDATTILRVFKHLFQCIQWSDEEPCDFRRYL